MTLDLLLKGGDVVDVDRQILLRACDVGVRDGRIVAVEPDVDPDVYDGADRVVDVRGQLVTPGLVDAHTHVFAGAGYYGLDASGVAWRSGVTTWIDAGSAGAYTFDAFREVTGRRPIRCRALLNISCIGLAGESYECRVIENCVVDAAVACVERNRDLIVGIKARIDHNTVGEQGLEPLRRARQAAEETGLPLMVHIGAGPPAVAEILPMLRPGDVLTHCATGVADGVVDHSGDVAPHVRDAYRRGVLFDVGHGVGGFSFPVMEALIRAGLPPHTVSSDLHATSARRAAFDLPTVITKMLACGMSLPWAIAAASRAPARVFGLGDDAGVLAVGAPADIAVFERRDGPVTVSDAYGELRSAPERLVNSLTVLGGAALEAPDGLDRESATPTSDDLAAPGTYPRPAVRTHR